jgi:hypothetical protein
MCELFSLFVIALRERIAQNLLTFFPIKGWQQKSKCLYSKLFTFTTLFASPIVQKHK